ncbi:hypothetical protein AMECASPLE_034952, partial [Ameca splendens]
KFPGREETKHYILRKLVTACQPQATVEKDLFPPVLPRTPPLETPHSSASSSRGSSPTFIHVSK